MAKKPNIVLLLSDQHRADTLHCAGNEVAQTPNLDRLAAEGVLFERCASSSPVCMPSRASFATGLRVNQHGVWGHSQFLDRHGPSHVRNIHDAGFHTAMFGKAHLYHNHLNDGHTRDLAHKLHDWGYETVHELRDVPPSDQCRCHYADFLESRGRLGLYQDYTRLWWTMAFRGLNHGWEDPPSPLPIDEHIDIYCPRMAANFIRDYSDDRPFYLQVCPTGPHTPFDSPAEFRRRFNPEDMPPAILEPTRGPLSPQVERRLRTGRLEHMTESQARLMRHYYYAKVALVDEGLGQVTQALEDKGELDNTWIIYTSDHGEMLGDHRLNQKLVFYEGAVHIPLIIRPPSYGEGWKTRGLTDHLDITATLLDIAGAEPIDGSPGRSLVSKINAGAEAPDAQQGRGVVFSEVERYYAMAWEDRFKMNIDAVTREPLELYDLEEDPQEVRNLVADLGYTKVVERISADYFEGQIGMDEDKLRQYRQAVKQGSVGSDTFARDLLRPFRA